MRSFILLFALCGPGAANADEMISTRPVPIEIDIAAASMAYSIDLNKLPPSSQQVGASLIPDLARIINNAGMARRFNDGFANYLAELNERATAGGGHLVLIRITTNDMGDNLLRPDFLVPVGAGFDPVDAYSEFLNRPVVQIPPDTSTGRDASYFVWIQKTGDATFSLSPIVREMVPQLQRQGNLLANQKVTRQAHKQAYRSFLKPSFDDRARHWAQRVVARQAAFREADRLRAVERMVKRMDVLQSEHHQLVQLHEQQLRRAQSNQSLLKTLDVALAIGSVIKDEVAPRVSVDHTLLKTQTERLQIEVAALEKSRDALASEFQKIDSELKTVPELH